MSGRSYPIWNQVEACIYKSPKHFGAKDTSQTQVFVGTSKSNSELLVTHTTTRRIEGDFTIFKFGVNEKVLFTKYMNTKTHEWFNELPKELAEK